MARKSQHVVPRNGRWAVVTEGSSGADSTFETQREAIDKARDTARRQGAELVIHGRDGRIREKNTYGSDPHPPQAVDPTYLADVEIRRYAGSRAAGAP